MPAICFFLAALTFSATAFGEEGLTTAATRLMTVAPTDATLQVSVTAEASRPLADVLAKVKEIALGPEHISTVFSTPGVASPAPGIPGVAAQTIYTFRLTVPLAQASASLQRMQQFGSANADLRIQVSTAGVGANLAALAEVQKQVFPELYKEAKARAEQAIRDAGLSPGRVLAISDSFVTTGFYVTALTTSAQVPYSVSVRLAFE